MIEEKKVVDSIKYRAKNQNSKESKSVNIPTKTKVETDAVVSTGKFSIKGVTLHTILVFLWIAFVLTLS